MADIKSEIQNSPINTASVASFQTTRILRLKEVLPRIHLCRASIYNHIAAGLFPRPITLGPRSVGWLESEIDAWLMARMQARMVSKT